MEVHIMTDKHDSASPPNILLMPEQRRRQYALSHTVMASTTLEHSGNGGTQTGSATGQPDLDQPKSTLWT